MSPNVAVIYGSVREKRQGIKAARFIFNKCKERGYEVTLIDPKEYNLPLVDKLYREYPRGTAPENLEELHNILAEADGYILVTGEYNHYIPPALTNLLDFFREEYLFKPAAIAGYSGGPIAGMRSAILLRIMCGELGIITTKTLLGFPHIQTAFDKHGKPVDESYDERIKRFLDEFEWYVNALKEARSHGVPF